MKLGAVILAAGSGTRLGGVAKALLPRGEQTYLERVVEAARAVGLVDGVVVIGPPYGDAVAGHARSLGMRVAVNADPSRGMASSIAIGFAAISEGEAEAAWLWPVDHPDVSVETLQRLIEARGDHEVAVPRFEGRGGHPPLVERAVWPRLAGCAALAGGARAVIGAADAISVEVDDPGVVRDIDTPDDLKVRRR
ncbi:MAG: nucleotidyltransferase family protein [Kofleriaceae bacterium]